MEKIKRPTARKVSLREIINGRYIEREGFESNYIESGERKISRARVLATVVARFISEDEKYGFLVLDDSTETIRVKVFKNMKILEKTEVGDLVDVIGKIRKYQDEVYINPEIITKIQNPNFMTLRMLELSQFHEKKTQSRAPAEEKNKLRAEILKIIEEEDEGSGAEYQQILEKADEDENQVDETINELLSEGLCYEPRPGRIKIL